MCAHTHTHACSAASTAVTWDTALSSRASQEVFPTTQSAFFTALVLCWQGIEGRDTVTSSLPCPSPQCRLTLHTAVGSPPALLASSGHHWAERHLGGSSKGLTLLLCLQLPFHVQGTVPKAQRFQSPDSEVKSLFLPCSFHKITKSQNG